MVEFDFSCPTSLWFDFRWIGSMASIINMTVWAANCMTVWFWKVVCMHKVSSTCIVEYTPNITLGHGLIRFGLVSGSTSGEDFMRWKIWRPIHVLLKRPGQMTGWWFACNPGERPEEDHQWSITQNKRQPTSYKFVSNYKCHCHTAVKKVSGGWRETGCANPSKSLFQRQRLLGLTLVLLLNGTVPRLFMRMSLLFLMLMGPVPQLSMMGPWSKMATVKLYL